MCCMFTLLLQILFKFIKTVPLKKPRLLLKGDKMAAEVEIDDSLYRYHNIIKLLLQETKTCLFG